MSDEPRCGAPYASCECVREFGHDGAHECDPEVCNGSWATDEDGETWNVVRLPGDGLPIWQWAMINLGRIRLPSM